MEMSSRITAVPTDSSYTHPRNKTAGTSLAIQWLRLHTPNGEGLGLIPAQGTISHIITAPTELSSLASKPKLMSTGFKYHAAVLTPLPEGPRAMGTSRDTILPQHLPRGP